MANLKYLSALVLFSLCVFISGCGGDEGDPSTTGNSKDREEILINWADNIIQPSYENFKTRLDVMISKGDAFAASPDLTTLAQLRSAWVDAYIEWQKNELFEFGPAEKYAVRNFYNIYPADVTLIGNYINDPSLSLDNTAASAAQGFPALDYMINGIAADDNAIVASYTDATEGPKRVAYLQRLLGRMNTLLTAVINEWNTTYRDTFVSKTGLDIASSMGRVVNAYVLEYERYVRSGKVGIPAGIFSSNVPQPAKVEAYYKKDISRTLAQTAHQAVHDFFNGKNVTTGVEGKSFKSYLDALDAKETSGTLLSTVINNQFTDVKSKLAILGADFSDQAVNNNAAMVDTYASMQTLVRLLKLDMTSAMSVTITYTDNDGD